MSRAVHSRYRRHPADLPSLGRAVRVSLRVRRFYCRNVACPRQTFAERVPQLVAPFARRTRRLAEAQGRTGAALGGEAGARLLSRLSMPASADTVLRLLNRLPLPLPTSPRVVGVDDWAKRKGRSYGTIVVDLERHRVVDMLPDRSATTLAGWLQQRPGIEVVARDRSTEYASGIAIGAPRAVQVADRWHLLANLRQAVERWLASAHGRLRRLPALPDEGGALPARRTGPFPRGAAAAQVGSDSRVRRLVLYDEVQRRRAAGEPLISIARTIEPGTRDGAQLRLRIELSGTRRTSPWPQHSRPASPASAGAGCRRLRGCRRAVAGAAGARLHRHGQAGAEMDERTASETGQDGATPMARAGTGQSRLC